MPSILSMRPRAPQHASTEQPVARTVQILLNDGAVIVPALATAPDMAEIEDELRPWFDCTPPGEGLFLGRNTRRFSGLFAKSAASAMLAIHPFILAVAETVLMGGDVKRCDAIQLNLTQAIAIDPGQGAQPVHRDDSMYPFAHDFETLVNVIWPVDDFTSDNGATRIALGSQAWPRDRRPLDHELVAAAAPSGSAIILLGSTLHGGGANLSAAPRRALVFNYSLGWLAQAEKLLLSIPPESARALPERLQRLIGYQVHRPSLGWIEERDPIEWLHGNVGPVAAAQDHFTPELAARLEQAFGAAGGERDG